MDRPVDGKFLLGADAKNSTLLNCPVLCKNVAKEFFIRGLNESVNGKSDVCIESYARADWLLLIFANIFSS